MKYAIVFIVLFAVGAGCAFADGTLISTWDYTASNMLFGLARHDTTGNLWCIDFDSANYGFFEYSTTGALLGGSITARDVDSTQDGAWNVTDNEILVGYYTDNLIDVYDGASGNFIESLDGPASFNEIWGVAFDDTSNTLYVGETNRIAYGTYVDAQTPISWTILIAGEAFDGRVTGLGTDGTRLYAVKRKDPATQVKVYCLVWDLAGGTPISNKYAHVDITEHFLDDVVDSFTPSGGAAWDGNHLWVVDQESVDRVIEIDLGSIGIKSASLGEIKAMFK